MMTTKTRQASRSSLVLAILLMIGPTGGLMEDAARAQTPDMPAPSTPSLNPLSTIDPSSLSAFRDRPLFSSTRRRPEDPALDEAPPDPADETTITATEPVQHLLGVILTPAGASAQLRDETNQTTITVREHDMVDGWSVVEISPTEVALSKDGETRRIRIFAQDE
jgi:hypothetical protein